MSVLKGVIELYHGSPIVVSAPVYGKGNIHNDYGIGLYCTQNEELAKEWACPEPRDGFANRYTIDTSGLDILELQSSEYHVLNWLAILLENRIFETAVPIANEAKEYILQTFLPNYKNRDIIKGYRADDSYFSFAKAFINNGLSLESLSLAMKLGKLGEQVCIKSEKAFSRLRFIDAAIALGEDYYIKRSTRDAKARREFHNLQATASSKNAVYAIDIIRQEWKNDDNRLR